jgi:hypothetical protein
VYYDDYDGGCPGCGVRDYGFDEPDVRSTLYIANCRCKPACVCTESEKKDYMGDAEGEGFGKDECICAVNGCECDRDEIKVRINRIWDQSCAYCDGADWRPEWHIVKDGKVIATVPSEDAAHAVIAAEYPDAEAEEPDDAWESEKWLRRAEGWG